MEFVHAIRTTYSVKMDDILLQARSQQNWLLMSLNPKRLLAQPANVSRPSFFAAIGALACFYAGRGKTKEARELLLRAMDVEALD